MGDSGAWNPMELLLTQSDVPVGFVLRDHRTRELEVGGGATARQGHRMFGKARFLRFGDAIWSEATVFHEIAAAHEGWQKLVEHHRAHPGYDGVQDGRETFGDESYVHTGTMKGRPGLWAAVRRGVVIHRFNTYGVSGDVSAALLRVQLAKQAPRTPSDVVLMCYAGLVESFGSQNLNRVNEWWQRLQLSIERGGFTNLLDPLVALREAWDGGDSGTVEAALKKLSDGVLSLVQGPEGAANGTVTGRDWDPARNEGN